MEQFLGELLSVAVDGLMDTKPAPLGIKRQLFSWDVETTSPFVFPQRKHLVGSTPHPVTVANKGL